jgi:VWFA-related protein
MLWHPPSRLHRGLALAALALLIAAAFPSLRAQNAPVPHSYSETRQSAPAQVSPTLKVEVRVVLVDVLATNKRGEAASGLTKDQFEVLEDGVPQALTFFEEHEEASATKTTSVPPGQNDAAGLPPNVYTSSQTVKASDCSNVLLLDWLNTQPADQSYVRSQVIKYLRTVPSRTRMAIFVLGSDLRIVQGFTTETARLTQALNDKNGLANPKSSGLLPTQARKASDQELIEMMSKADTAPVAIGAVREFQQTSTSTQTSDRAALTIQGLLELQRYLSAIPGRKNVLWFAGSFPVNVSPGSSLGADYERESEETAQKFGPSRIAIYPISAEGPTMNAALDPSQGLDHRAGPQEMAPDREAGPNQAAMETLARETGGQAFHNVNGLEREIQHAVQDGEHCYTLTYSPTNSRKDGKFRTIQVNLKSGNYKLSYRRGYYAEAPGGPHSVQQTAQGDHLLGLMRFGMPDFDQIQYSVRVAPVDPQPPAGADRAGANVAMTGPITRFRVDFTIPLRELKLKSEQSGMLHDVLQLTLVAYEKNGNPLNLETTENEVNVPEKVMQGGQNVEIHAKQEIDVPRGNVYLRVGLYEQASGKVGTIGIPLPGPAATPANPAK